MPEKNSLNHINDNVVREEDCATIAKHGNSSINNSLNNVNENPTELYYGVSVPSELFSDAVEGKQLVFRDKIETLQAVKKYKGARFKVFNTEADAITFSSQPVEESCGVLKNDVPLSPSLVTPEEEGSSPTGPNSLGSNGEIPYKLKYALVVGEKSSPFKAPKSQDIVKLRKAIEKGDAEFFEEVVWTNPRYLVGSGDNPTIMQEGFRYNGLHVAAKAKQAEMCTMILDTLQTSEFFELLYSDDTEDIRAQRMAFVIDLYLNMPDKRLCETPLHFASKFGAADVVRVLASHPACDKRRKNKYGLEAGQIICERCPSCAIELKQEVEDAFEDQYFVPVLRSVDNSDQPLVGVPYPSEKVEIPYRTEASNNSNESLSVMAVAGPMTPTQARMFYKQWKTPGRMSTDCIKQHHIRLSDTEKGLERIGRDLARNMKTQWTEYWPVLRTWCDITTTEGLSILESHLRKLYFQLLVKVYQNSDANEPKTPVTQKFDSNLCLPLSQSTPLKCDISDSSGNSSGGISQLCGALSDFHVSDQSGNPFSITSPDMPSVLKPFNGSRCYDSDQSTSCDKSSSFEFSTKPDLSDECLSTSNHKSHGDCEYDEPCSYKLPALSNIDSDLSSKYDLSFCKSSEIFKSTPLQNSAEVQDTKCTIAEKSSLKETTTYVHKTYSFDKLHSKSVCFDETNMNQKYKTVNKKMDIISSSPRNFNSRPLNGGLTDCIIDEEADVVNRSNDIHFATGNIIRCMFDAFNHLLENVAIFDGNKADIYISKHIFPEIKHLLKYSYNSEVDLHTIHSSIACEFCELLYTKISFYDTQVINMYITLFLESDLTCSSDDDGSDSFTEHNIFKSKKVQRQHLSCIFKFILEYIASNNDNNIDIKMCNCSWKPSVVHRSSPYLRNYRPNSSFNSYKHGLILRPSKLGIKLECERSKDLSHSDSDDEEDKFVTPPSSVESSDDELTTPEEGIEVYVEGDQPSKSDVDILRAIEYISVDPTIYPHISRWMHLISLKDEKTVKSWPSPAVKKYREHRNKVSEALRNSPLSPLATVYSDTASSGDSLQQTPVRKLRDNSFTVERRELFSPFTEGRDYL